MSFSLLRYEIVDILRGQFALIAKFTQPIRLSSDSASILNKKRRRKNIYKIWEHMVQRYGIYSWDLSDPLQHMALRLVNTQLAKARFLVGVQPWEPAKDPEDKAAEETRYEAFSNCEITSCLRIVTD
jgi:hypothetical protein